jgi:hypothetical protein
MGRFMIGGPRPDNIRLVIEKQDKPLDQWRSQGVITEEQERDIRQVATEYVSGDVVLFRQGDVDEGSAVAHFYTVMY